MSGLHPNMYTPSSKSDYPSSNMSSSKIPSAINSIVPPNEKIAPKISVLTENFNETEKRKQFNRIEFLKNEISQTHSQTKIACDSCFSELSKIELLVFDCLLTEYLLLDPPNDIHKFIPYLSRPAFSLLNGDRNDEERAESYTRYLIDRLQGSIQNLQKLKDHRINQPKRSGDILGLIKSLSQCTPNGSAVVSRPPSRMPYDQAPPQNQIQPSPAQSISSSYSAGYNGTTQGSAETQNQQISPGNSQENQQFLQQFKNFNPVSPDFTKWMNKNLTLSSSSAENAQLRTAFCSVSSRYQSVCELKAAVQALKQSKVSPQSVDYQLCGLENIRKSPFLTSVQNNYKFLQRMLNQIRQQRSVMIPQCETMMEECNEAIANLEQCQKKLKQDCLAQEAKLRNKIEKSKADVHAKKLELTPFALSFTDPKNEKIKETYIGIDDSIIDEIAAKMNENPAFTDQHKALLNDIKKRRSHTKELCQKSLTSMEKAFVSLNPIYNAVSDANRIAELNRQNTRKKEQLNAYAKNLTELENMLKVTDIQNWCKKIEEVNNQFIMLQNDSEKLNSLIQPLTDQQDEAAYDAEIDELDEKTQQLLQEKIQLEIEIADAKLEHDKAAEDLFSTIQDLVTMQQSSANIHSEVEEKQIKKMEKLILCPVCHNNRRDCLLSTCMHPICKQCMKNAKGVCPICKTSFSQNDVKPFYFQN